METMTGDGKVKHLYTRFLWMQEVVRKGLVKLGKILRSNNAADVITKPISLTNYQHMLG